MFVSRKLKLILGGIALGLVIVFTLNHLQPAVADDKSGITWSENNVGLATAVDSPNVKQITFTSRKELEDVAFAVSPSIAPFVSIQPSKITKVPKNRPQTITITFEPPATTTQYGKFSGTITVLEDVECEQEEDKDKDKCPASGQGENCSKKENQDQSCSKPGKVVPIPLSINSLIVSPRIELSSARSVGSLGKVAFSGATPGTFNPSSLILRFDLTGATFNPDNVSILVNDVRLPSTNFQISPTAVTAPLILAEGRNNVLLAAGDTNFRLLVSNPTLWIGSRTLSVNVVDANNLPVEGATVIARLGDDPTVNAQATTVNGRATFQNLPNRAILLEATASGNRLATRTTTGAAGTVQLQILGFNPVSTISNNAFSQGTAGWEIGNAPVQVVPHVEGTFTPLEDIVQSLNLAPAPSGGLLPQSSLAKPRTERYAELLQKRPNIFRGQRKLLLPGQVPLLQPLVAPEADNDLIVNTRGEGPQRVSRTFQAPVGALETYVRYKFISSEIPGGYFGTQFNDSYSISIRTQNPATGVTDTQSINGLGLSNFDANGATDWRQVSIPLSGNGDTVQVDLSVSNVADGAFDSQLIADFVGTPRVRFGSLSGVVKGDTADLDVTVQQLNPSQPITLTLTTTTGTGSAQFVANGSKTLQITQSGKVTIQGITESSQRDNIRVRATVNGVNVSETQKDAVFSVVSVSVAFRNSGTFSSNNAARSNIIAFLGQDRLGTFLSTGGGGRLQRTAVEIVGTVSPQNYQGKIILSRTKQVAVFAGGFPQPVRGLNALPGDLSFSNARDDDPTPNGKIYDFDAPGFPAIPNAGLVTNYRLNLQQFAILGGQPDDQNAVVVGGKKASSNLNWFSRTSPVNRGGDDVLDTTYPGDNISGLGTTPLTPDLQP